MKADEPRQNRIPFMMSDSELALVDEWRFDNRIGTRAEAIRRLCQIGLTSSHYAHQNIDILGALNDYIRKNSESPEGGAQSTVLSNADAKIFKDFVARTLLMMVRAIEYGGAPSLDVVLARDDRLREMFRKADDE